MGHESLCGSYSYSYVTICTNLVAAKYSYRKKAAIYMALDCTDTVVD